MTASASGDGDTVGLVLASASPRRAELLARTGLRYEVDAADVDERPLPGELAAEHVVRVATDKAHVVAARHPGSVVLAADTEVVLDGTALGKPADDRHASELLGRLAGRSHGVLSAVVIIAPDGVEHAELVRAEVTMHDADDELIAWYVGTGEPLDKAGAYGLQGIGALLVDRLDGDPTTVIGLPLRVTLDLLRLAGVRWPP